MISVIVVLVQAGVWGTGLIGFAADHYTRRRAPGDVGTRTTIQAVGYAGRFVLWVLLAVTALQNFGINVTALVTGLGIGGIAIALAVQNILGDLFAALAIVLDKPFVVGDSVQVDTIAGTIEHIGIKTTRIRSVTGEQVVIANNDLLKSRIRNMQRMEQRRAVFHVDVAFDTPPDKIAALPSIIQKIVEAQPLARFDYKTYANIQHTINVELLRVFQREQIELATRTTPLPPST